MNVLTVENAMASLVPDEAIMNKIYLIRGVKVMIDRDIALLYGVPTKVLNQAVKRNTKRFPEDFMFQMTSVEFENWKSQIVTSNADKMGLRKYFKKSKKSKRRILNKTMRFC